MSKKLIVVGKLQGGDKDLPPIVATKLVITIDLTRPELRMAGETSPALVVGATHLVACDALKYGLRPTEGPWGGSLCMPGLDKPVGWWVIHAGGEDDD